MNAESIFATRFVHPVARVYGSSVTIDTLTLENFGKLIIFEPTID